VPAQRYTLAVTFSLLCWVFRLLCLTFSPAAERQACALANEAVEQAIAERVEALKGHEYCQFRCYDALDDLDGDRIEDLIVTFNVEGPEGGGNHYESELLVFLSTRLQRPLQLEVGHRGSRVPQSIGVRNHVIIIEMAEWQESDPLCCPSGRGKLFVKLLKNQLVVSPGA
jgi:hypothetical protein